MFIVAVRNVYRAGRAAQTVATDEQKPMIDAALRQFDALTGDAKEMRDMFEHFDAYLLGVGDRQRSHKLKYIHFYVRGKKNEVRLSDLAVDVKLALDATDAVAAAVILDKP